MRRSLLMAAGFAAVALHPVSALAQAVPQTTIQVPRNVFVRDVAVSATQKVVIGNGATVGGATPTTPVVIANTGSVLTQLGLGTHVNANIFSVAPVWLSAGATVVGNVSTTSAPLALPGQISGVVNTAAVLTPTPFAWDLPSLPSNGDMHLSFLANATLAPGGYGQINVDAGSTLTLTAGIYAADRFHIDPLAFVKFDTSAGPIQLYVTTAMDIFAGVTTIGSPSNLLLVYAGPNKVTINSPFNGNVVAPNAVVELESVGIPYFHTGSFFASEVDVDANVTLKLAAFKWDSIAQLAGNDGNAIASIPSAAITPAPHPDTAPNMSATFHATGGGNGYYDTIHLLPADPTHGVVAPTFCDDSNPPVPVATPTDAQLNAAPPAGSTCTGGGSSDSCAIDPSTVTTLCTTDADCTGGAICGVRCLDDQCATTEHRCGKQPASCAGLPAASSCKQYRLCPRPGAVGAPNPGHLAAALPQTTTPASTAVPQPSQKDTVPSTYSTLSTGLCADTTIVPTALTQTANKPADDGSPEWGVFFTPTFDFGMSPKKTSDGIGELTDLHASSDAEFGGIVFGKRVNIFGGVLSLTATDCGLTFTATVKLFGDAVATWTPSGAQKASFAIDPQGNMGTPSADTVSCQGKRTASQDALKAVRKSNVFAREAYSYYTTNGLTTDLCNEVMHEVRRRPPAIPIARTPAAFPIPSGSTS